MDEWNARTELLLGKEALLKLKNARVAVFGLGGVGGYAAHALARSGIGSIDLIDNDKVALSNINRQLAAYHSTVGLDKVQVIANQLLDINPDLKIVQHNLFFLPQNADQIDFSVYDYVLDAIDTVSGKLEIIKRCNALGVPVVSCMGTGNKLHPEMLELADIYQTSVCPLARVMRSLCRKNGIEKLTVVYSKEPAMPPCAPASSENRRQIPGSAVFVPGAAGLLMASKAVQDLIVEEKERA